MVAVRGAAADVVPWRRGEKRLIEPMAVMTTMYYVVAGVQPVHVRCDVGGMGHVMLDMTCDVCYSV